MDKRDREPNTAIQPAKGALTNDNITFMIHMSSESILSLSLATFTMAYTLTTLAAMANMVNENTN
jgi:hypothetical protein